MTLHHTTTIGRRALVTSIVVVGLATGAAGAGASPAQDVAAPTGASAYPTRHPTDTSGAIRYTNPRQRSRGVGAGGGQL